MRRLDRVDSGGWGGVVTSTGTLGGSTPATPTTPSTTQTAQGADAAAVESSQANILPAVPIKNFLIGGDGLVTFPWAVWFTKLHKRVGGVVSADAGSDALLFDDPNSAEITDLRNQVSELKAMVNLLVDNYPSDLVRRGDTRSSFFGAAVTTKPTAITAATALTSAYGTGGTALADVGAAYSQDHKPRDAHQ
jgi:hypothetical protein